jgi:hypothetical protein
MADNHSQPPRQRRGDRDETYYIIEENSGLPSADYLSEELTEEDDIIIITEREEQPNSGNGKR